MNMGKGAVKELTESEFSSFINDKKKPLIIIDFFADWCHPCTMMASIIHKIAEKYPKVKFAKINVDNAGKLAMQYKVSSIPCIIFFKEGKEINRIAQAVDEDVFEEKVRDYIKN